MLVWLNIHGVGLSALLVSTNRAMRRPTHSGTSDKTGSTFFLCMQNFVSIVANLELIAVEEYL